MIEQQDIKPILFGPRNKKALKKLYPELDEEPVFKGIEGADLLFAWYIGIPNSPVDHEMTDMMRYRVAANHCFTDEDKKRVYGSGDFPEEIKFAIDRFRKYSPEARSSAKIIVQKIFHNFQKMVDVNVDKDFLYTDKDGNIMTDWTGRKQYIDSATTISKTLPDLLKQVEEGFGITEKKSDEGSGVKSIDKFHQQNKGKSL